MAGAGGPVPAIVSAVPVRDVVADERAAEAVAAGAGEMARLVRAAAWERTPLGPAHRWDPAVRATVDLVLASPVAMAFAFGADLTMVYNDAYADLLGARHPEALGRCAREVFADLWGEPGVGPALERVFRTGRPYLEAETQLPGESETAFFTQGMSAVRDRHGAIVGVLTVAAETTQVTRRLQTLGELASSLAATLNLDDVARVALAYVTSSFDVDHATVVVDDGPSWRAVRRLRGEILDEADERLPPVWRRMPGNSPSPLAEAAATGVAGFTDDGAPLHQVATDRHDQWVRAFAALPLVTPSLRGAIGIGYRVAHTWRPAERAVLRAAAELVAQAAERARRFEAQYGTAQLLQRSMLPEHLPELDRFRIAARYDVGVDGNAAGGDFYDAFMLTDGRLAVALGDVAGHDVHAAALMGQVRAALRALALTDPEPSAVLTGLDRLVASLGAEARNTERFVTVVYGLLDPEDATLSLASAGHPPPVVRHAAGPVPGATSLVELPPGPPLGVGGRWRPTVVRLIPGDALLLFSDGVIERRGRALSDGLAALQETVAAAPSGDPRSLCALATRAVAGATDDDVAVLAIEYAVTPSRSATMAAPAEPTAPSRVRHWMTSRLRSWGVPEPVIGAAVLCASELTTNALLHAGTAATVHIDLSAERLLVSVADTGTRGGVVRARAEALSSRGRGLGLIEEMSDAWGTDPTVRGTTVWFELLLP
ncbi:SpoIIE family protein phosphatase [Spirilliplanes yamanashiensis]|uniref:SpoIIE family protein phosphatase n=1 Tax=Spirilliplanes yamanashiensis TaxID=42233 RepID=UPI00194E6715